MKKKKSRFNDENGYDDDDDAKYGGDLRLDKVYDDSNERSSRGSSSESGEAKFDEYDLAYDLGLELETTTKTADSRRRKSGKPDERKQKKQKPSWERID